MMKKWDIEVVRWIVRRADGESRKIGQIRYAVEGQWWKVNGQRLFSCSWDNERVQDRRFVKGANRRCDCIACELKTYAKQNA